ncbi:hypothetical protein CRM22_001051 [Opisthorchis felineus]|uniref:Gamma-tubulin complex component 6 n=2 Tax=Opisthorchis felineus TaxID=147828 RepID=A0A4S2MCA6_OPIFE|nr:hypothetical protein CRM22_001051 [Opisthorchis felineus]
MERLGDGFLSVYRVLDELIKYRWKDARHPRGELGEIRRSLRAKALESFFLFQKGPHKFVDGIYPEPSNLLLTKLLNAVVLSFEKCKGEARAKTLRKLVESLNPDLMAFLLVLAAFHPDDTASQTIRIPDKREILNSTPSDNEVLKYSTFDSSTFTLPIGGLGEQCHSQDQGYQCTFLDYFSSSCTERNPFMSVQKLNHDNLQGKHFLGAFTSLGCDAKATLCRNGLSTLRIPRLSSESSGSMSYAFDQCKYVNKSGDEDEGFSDACDRHLCPSPLTDESARFLVSSLLANTVPGVRDTLLDHFYPFTRTSSDSEHILRDHGRKEPQKVKRYCWVSRGINQDSRELPFLTESGPWGSAVLNDVYQERYNFDSSCRTVEHESNVCSDTLPPELLTNSRTREHRRSFFHDLLLLRIGLQSTRFLWDVPTKMGQVGGGDEPLAGRFTHCPNKTDAISLGISEAALANTVKEHLRAGTAYRRLNWFAHKVVPLAPIPGRTWQGPTWACFIHAISQWLMAYEEAVQLVLKEELDVFRRPISSSSGVLELSHRLKTLTDRISFVADLCMLKGASCPLLNSRGIELLVYLATRADHFACTPAEPIARFLFKRACGPFLGFLEQLLLDGTWDASGSEFNLLASNSHLLRRDAAFWSGAFKFTAVKPEDKRTYGFMNLLPAEFEQNVLRGAKSIHLLKLIAPKHFLFTNRVHFPRLCFPLNSAEVKGQQHALKDYLEKLRQAAVQSQATRYQLWQKMEQAKQDALKRAMATHARNISAVEDERRGVQAALRTKQEKEYVALKRAAEQSAIRKVVTAAAERDTDKVTMQETLQTETGVKPSIGGEKIDHVSPVAGAQDPDKLGGVVTVDLKASENEPCLPDAAGDTSHAIDHNTLLGSSEPASATSSISEVINSLHPVTDSDQCRQVSPNTALGATDPLDRFRAKYKQRNAGICEPKDTLYTVLYPNRKDPTVNTSAETTDAMGSGPATSAPVRLGHPSDSTIQSVLYGEGSGPACRPSKWKEERCAQDADRALVESAEPDAIKFFEEALELEDSDSTGSRVQAFTTEFPRLDQLTLVDPFESLRCPTAGHHPADSVTELNTSQSDLDVIPLHVLLYKVVLAPITSYIYQLDLALCNHVLYSLNLAGQFHRLRQIYFLQDGEFAQVLLTGLFEKVYDLSPEQCDARTVQFLHNLMQSTVRKFRPSVRLPDGEEMTAPFGIDDQVPLVIDVPMDLVLDEQPTVTTYRPTPLDIPSHSVFDRLFIVYQPPWPLNIILHDKVISKYNLVFRQLVRVKYAAWTLQSIYHELRHFGTTGLLDASAEFSNVYLWLFEMQQVVCGLESYLSNQAVKTSWAQFATTMLSDETDGVDMRRPVHHRPENLDQLASAHHSYLQEVLRCCLADPADQELQQVLHGLLCCVHWFHKVLSSGQWIQRSKVTQAHIDHTGWQQLCAAHQSFRQHARFLRRRAGSLVSVARFGSIRSVLRQLILALGTNDFYANSAALSSDFSRPIT